MEKILPLKMGSTQSHPTEKEEHDRVEQLKATVAHYLPDFAKGIEQAQKETDDATFVIHQDAFAAGYHLDEYMIFGMALKYAGLHGVNVHVIGKNRDTF